MIATLVAVARRLAGSTAFRMLCTVALLAIVFSSVDWNGISDRVRDGEPLYGLGAVLALIAALTVGAWRWNSLLRVADAPLPLPDLARIYAVTSFANAFLPTSVGGDVARPLMVSRRGPLLVRAATTVLIERLLALVALLGLAWLGVAIARDVVSLGSQTSLAVASLLLGGAVVVLLTRPSLLRRAAQAVVPARLSPHLDEMAGVVRKLLRDRARLAVVLAQSIVFQILVTLQIVLLARMINVDVPFGLAAVALALVTLAMLMPISIGGFGVREGSYVLILAGADVSHSDAVLISLLSVVALFVATLPGAVALVRGGFRSATVYQ